MSFWTFLALLTLTPFGWIAMIIVGGVIIEIVSTIKQK